ncbi:MULTISPECIES: hypothetical protein [unclassified Sphingopyxis]|uniref:hypothetical protein n=1 Tax=unclassified Sphingopyxis TaxID=2614943 RepID=UPI0024AE1746|nr:MULTISPECIES: hypothetical protein [unclassified Sphingopyxis]
MGNFSFQAASKARCGLTLFDKNNVAAALSELKLAKLRILGADKFVQFDDDRIQPIDQIDLSHETDFSAAYDAVSNFVTAPDERSGILFELVWN